MAGTETKDAVSANTKGPTEAPARKKKKKNAPDRPQPTWLFPPDEENPVLNPKNKSQEEIDRETNERLEAIKFLKHKAVTAPVKPAPPTMLLTLIGAFLASYGFNSTGRIFSLERNARKKLEGWDDKIGAEIPKSMPDLVKIYKQWYKDWQDTKADDDSDQEMADADADATSGHKQSQTKARKVTEPTEDTSSSGSESESSKRGGAKLNGTRKASRSSSSNSESDADDEQGIIKASSPQPQVERFGKGLTRKTVKDAAESSSESDSDFDSDSDRAACVKKKQKKSEKTEVSKKLTKEKGVSIVEKGSPKPEIDAKVTPLVSDGSDSGSSSESSSSQDPDVDTKMKDVSAQRLTTVPPPTDRTSSADSSTTMNASSPTKVVAIEANTSSASSSSSPSSSSASPSSPPPKNTTQPRKGSKRTRSASPAPTATVQTNGKTANHAAVSESNLEPAAKLAKRSKNDKSAPKAGVPFRRIPENQVVDPRMASNAYVSYDYADKAHKDLSVTRGKGFTKEKNKKKRGAYQGGAIDVAGGKGVKFTD